jgi:transposase-like protein
VARKRFSKAFKAKVALEAIRGEKALAELSSQYGVHSTQISAWKRRALEELPEAFSGAPQRSERERQAHEDRLYRQIGKLQVEVDWLKKQSTELGL